MTIQQRIKEVVETVKKGCRYIPEEEREDVLDAVKDLGHQWQSANTTGRVMSIATGLIAKGMTIDDVAEGTDLESFESTGSEAIFKALPLPIYSALHTEILTEAMGGMDE